MATNGRAMKRRRGWVVAGVERAKKNAGGRRPLQNAATPSQGLFIAGSKRVCTEIGGLADLLLSHELCELGGFAELREIGVLHEEIAIVEAVVEGFAQILQRAVLLAGFSKELGEAIILAGTVARLRGAGDDLARVGSEHVGVEAEGDLIGLEAGLIFAVREVGGAEIGGDDGGVGHELKRFAIEANGLLVMALSKVGCTQIIESLGVIGTDEEGLLVVFAGFIEGEEVMVGDTEFVECDSVGRRLAVGIDSGEILLACHEQIPALFSRHG